MASGAVRTGLKAVYVSNSRRGVSRRDVLRGGLGGALSLGVAAVLPGSRASATVATAPTDVTGTAAAATRAGDAAFGLTWLPGDTHVHDDHSSDGSDLRQTAGQNSRGLLSVGNQIQYAEIVGLAWLPLTDHRTYDQHWDPQWTSASLLLVPGEEANGSPHAIVLGALDEIVDGANPPGPSYRHVQQSVWDAHSQGAVWGTAHPTYNGQPASANRDVVGINWIEVFNRAGNPDGDVDYAEARWNEGFRTGVSGACDCHYKALQSSAGPGQPTTWVLATPGSERALLQALYVGRMAVGQSTEVGFATIEADLDGDGRYEGVNGDELHAAAGTPGTLRVRVKALVGDVVDVYAAPGRSAGPLATMTVTGADQSWTHPVTVPSGGGWWRVEVRGPGPMPGLQETNPDPSGNQLRTLSAPVFATTGAATQSAPSTPLPAPLAPPGADDATAPVVLGRPGTFTAFPDLAVAGAQTHVVAERHGPGRTTVVYRRLPDGTEVVLPPAETGTARLPRVAALGDEVWLVWQEERAGQVPHRPDIFARQSLDGGASWRPEVRVTVVAAGVRVGHPAVVLPAAGRPVVAWHENTGQGAFDVRVMQLGVDATPIAVSAPGKTVSAGTPDDTRSPKYPASLFPDLAVLPDGGVAVVWHDDRHDPDPLFTGHYDPSQLPRADLDTTDPDAWEPMLAVRPPGGSWGPVLRIAPDTERAQRHPALVARADGLLACVWEAKSARNAAGEDVRLRWATSADGGAHWTAPAPLDPPPVGGMGQRPRLGLDPDGTVRVAWYDSRAADWRWRVRTATLTADASGWQGAADLTHVGNGTWPAVDGGRVAFATDRGAAAQRDPSQRVAVADLVPSSPTALPEMPVPVVIPAAGLLVGAAALAAHRAHAHRQETP